MSMTPPPGWYRDPSGPHLERWWDGTAWTEHRRAPEDAAPSAPSVPPGPTPSAPGPEGFGPPPAGSQAYGSQAAPSPQAYGAQPPGPQAYGSPSTVPLTPGPPSAAAGGGGSGQAPKVVALIAAGVVLLTAIVTGVIVLGKDDGGGEPDTAPTLANSEPVDRETASASDTPTPTETASEPPVGDPAVVTDQLNGITLPLLNGWVRPRTFTEADVLMTTDGTYECPADFGSCRHGKVLTHTATEDEGTTPEAIAKSDIQDAAGDAYDRDLVGRRPFGGIESHKVVKSGPVSVAGRAGYLVRWQVTTAEGPGGHVQSLAFTPSGGTQSPVVVRYVFDAGEDGPPLADMDRFTKGIRSTR